MLASSNRRRNALLQLSNLRNRAGQKLRFETSRCRSIYGDQEKTAGSKRLLLAQICRLDINLKKAKAAFKKFKQIIKNFAQIFSEMKRLVNICARVKFADKHFRANK
jgi:hypothetical protein